MRQISRAVKYAIPFNLFIVFYIFVLYAEINSRLVFASGGVVLLLIDALYFRVQRGVQTTKPSLSMYTVAAIFLIGALCAPFQMIRDHIPLWALAGLVPAAFVGVYCLRSALRAQKRQADAYYIESQRKATGT